MPRDHSKAAAIGRAHAEEAWARRYAERVAKLELTLEAQESVDQLCKALGIKPLALYRQLVRHGDNDLARRAGLTRARYRSGRP